MELYTTYMPDFRCKDDDGNGYGIVNSKVGLISIDEVLHAGGVIRNTKNYYLVNDTPFWTMSPSGKYSSDTGLIWRVYGKGYVDDDPIYSTYSIRPTISINRNILVSGSGTIDNPWIVQN